VLLLAGASEAGRLADAWRSDDGGRFWRRLPQPPWPARWQASLAVLPDGEVLLMAGEAAAGCGEEEGQGEAGPEGRGRLLADVWRSDDGGRSWQQMPDPPWPARRQACAAALPNGRVLLCAGWQGSERSHHDDAWCSEDGGHSWRRLRAPPWPPRYGASLVTLPKGDLALLAGESFGVFLADAWRSRDGGLSWRPAARTPWPARLGAGAVATQSDALLLLGGHGDEKFLRDAWRVPHSWQEWEAASPELGAGDEGFGEGLEEAEDTTEAQFSRHMSLPATREDDLQLTGQLSSSLQPELPAETRPGVVPDAYGAHAGKYQKGDAVEYLASSYLIWIPASVADVDPEGGIVLSAKPGIWLSVDDQATVVRPSPFSTRAAQSKHSNLEVGGHDKNGRWWAAAPEWVARYVDAQSPEMQVIQRQPPAKGKGP